MERPVVVLNLKAYREATGERAVSLAGMAERVAREKRADIWIAPQTTDIYRVSRVVDRVRVMAQHVDPVEPGAATGHVTLLAIMEAGARGTLVNHAEKRVPLEQIGKTIEMAKRAGVMVVACARDENEAVEIARLGPDFVAVEPPELIGGNVSVSSARPELVSRSVESVKSVSPNVGVLVGAGVKKREDLDRAIELGASGVLLASGFVKAEDPESFLRSLLGSY